MRGSFDKCNKMGAKAEENLISDRDTVDETREKLISRDFVLIK